MIQADDRREHERQQPRQQQHQQDVAEVEEDLRDLRRAGPARRPASPGPAAVEPAPLGVVGADRGSALLHLGLGHPRSLRCPPRSRACSIGRVTQRSSGEAGHPATAAAEPRANEPRGRFRYRIGPAAPPRLRRRSSPGRTCWTSAPAGGDDRSRQRRTACTTSGSMSAGAELARPAGSYGPRRTWPTSRHPCPRWRAARPHRQLAGPRARGATWPRRSTPAALTSGRRPDGPRVHPEVVDPRVRPGSCPARGHQASRLAVGPGARGIFPAYFDRLLGERAPGAAPGRERGGDRAALQRQWLSALAAGRSGWPWSAYHDLMPAAATTPWRVTTSSSLAARRRRAWRPMRALRPPLSRAGPSPIRSWTRASSRRPSARACWPGAQDLLDVAGPCLQLAGRSRASAKVADDPVGEQPLRVDAAGPRRPLAVPDVS